MKATQISNLISKLQDVTISEGIVIVGRRVSRNSEKAIPSLFNSLGEDKFLEFIHKNLVDASEEDGPGGLYDILKSRPYIQKLSSSITVMYDVKDDLKEFLSVELNLKDGWISFTYGAWFVVEQGKDPTYGDKTEEFESTTVKIFDISNPRRILVDVLKEIYFSPEAERFRESFYRPVEV